MKLFFRDMSLAYDLAFYLGVAVVAVVSLYALAGFVATWCLKHRS